MDHCQSAWVRLDTELLLHLLYDYHCNGYYHSGQRTDISSTLGLWFTQELYGNMQPQVLCQLLVWRSYQTLQVLNKSQRYIFRSKIGKNTHDDPHVYTADAYMDANDTQTHAHTYTHTRTHTHTHTQRHTHAEVTLHNFLILLSVWHKSSFLRLFIPISSSFQSGLSPWLTAGVASGWKQNTGKNLLALFVSDTGRYDKTGLFNHREHQAYWGKILCFCHTQSLGSNPIYL